MPNHCENQLRVEGTPYHVREFARDHYRKPSKWDGGVDSHKSILDFSYSVPYPEDMGERRALARPTDSGWYNWHCDNWGTKWNAYEVQPETFPEVLDDCEDGDLTYTFETAWSPPMEWLEHASRKYPALTFTITFVETGCDFAGKIQVEDGETNILEDFEPSSLVDDPESDDAWEEVQQKTYEKLGF